MRNANHALLLIAAADGPISAEDAVKLRDEACRLTQYHEHVGDRGRRREIVRDVRDLIRRLNPASVADVMAWLETVDPDHVEPQALEATAQPSAIAEAPRVANVALVQVSESQHAATRAALEAATKTAGELRAKLAAELEVEANAKAAIEVDTADDSPAFEALEAATRKVTRLRVRSEAADAEVARIASVLDAEERAINEAAFDAAREASSDRVLRGRLVPIAQRIAEIDAERQRCIQEAYRVTHQQNLAGREALRLAGVLGLDGERILHGDRAQMGGQHHLDRSAVRPIAPVMNFLSDLVAEFAPAQAHDRAAE